MSSDPDASAAASAARVERLASSPLFPFEGEHRLKPLGEPMAHELVRDGEAPDRPCHSCGRDERVLWHDERWKITPLAPSVNPVGLFLETVEHLDLEDFDDRLAAEYGVLTRHLVTAIDSLDSVGRVHVHRWGDGSSHFHVWFQGRPARQPELYGWGNVLWAQVLPALPAEVVTANHALVVAAFAGAVGGTVVS
ncbi:MAG: hypothetical protein R2713_11770 [Ilumatobacteraceae bacterium]|nr:hypothetical protein [Acidimicrobiales bacterium]MCB9394051.1 hypothetical protein [Acidimicrobiaceae bacterium]